MTHTHTHTHTQAESLQTNSRLTHLSLRHNRIGSEGCAALADIFPLLPRGPGVSVCRLQVLHLSDNEIDDEGAAHLVHRLAQSSRVSIEGNSSHKAAAAAASEGAQMTSLDLSSNNLRERTADAAGLLLAWRFLVLFAAQFLVVIRRRSVLLSKNQRNVMCGNAAVV